MNARHLRSALFLALVTGLLFVAVPLMFLLSPRRVLDHAYREIAYRTIVEEVTRQTTDDFGTAAAILRYVSTHEYALASVPSTDTTVWDDLVRGTGLCDQKAWALSTLLAKKRIPSSLLMLRGFDAESHHTVASVYLGGRWRLFDPFFGFVLSTLAGNPATFEDVQRGDVNIAASGGKLAAVSRYDPTFLPSYLRLFERRFRPTMGVPLTSNKDVIRRAVTAVLDFYYGLLGRRFAVAFQDAYLMRTTGRDSDADLFLRGRHYDLFRRSDEALAMYRRLLAEHPRSPLTEDTLYFLGRLQLDLGRYVEARQSFEELLRQFGNGWRWVPVARYYKGRTLEQQGKTAAAIEEYRLSTVDPQVDSALRLVALGVTRPDEASRED